jgi:hypothetical protein
VPDAEVRPAGKVVVAGKVLGLTRSQPGICRPCITAVVALVVAPRPADRLVEVLRHARAAVRPGGRVLVVDERAAESFTAPGDGTERFFAAASGIWHLPQGRVSPGPESAGTLIRPAAMLDLVRRVGCADAGIFPSGHRAWRFCRLVR